MSSHKTSDKISRKLDYLETECFSFPNNTEKLARIEETIDYYKLKIKKISETNRIDGDTHSYYYNLICKELDNIGNLSLPALDCFDKLEEMYLLKFPKSPELAKRIWMDHYRDINRPYSLLKNRCTNLLNELDHAYRVKYKSDPPNYNNKILNYFDK